jgi:hypothetical protein
VNKESLLLSEIILGVPGRWKDSQDIVLSIAEQSNGYLFAGSVLMHTSTKSGFSLEIYERDPQLVKAFEIAGILCLENC